MPETSVIIRSFNEADYIGDVLEAVKAQEYQDFEIILVDSGSTDGTLEIAERYVDSIEFVSPQNFTFGYSCNVGCEAASGDYCSFLSAHAIPTNDQWLGTMIENLYQEEVAMTYSNQVGAKTTKFSEQRLFDELFPETSRRQRPPDYWANNASSAIKRSLWNEHKFDEYLTGHEDIEWAKYFMDNGYTVVYEADACIYHIHDENWEQVFNRFEREAIADVEIGIKSPSDRWREYLAIPKDIFKDTLAAISQKKIDISLIEEIIRFRYNQHMGTASGLITERDLENSRFKYFYGEANKSVLLENNGSTLIEESPLPNIKPNEVLIENEYVGVDPEFDRPIDSGEYPIIPSGNYVGTVVELGANANSVEVGDRVIGGTRFHCGICSACADETYKKCKNPVRLGIDTEQGAYSRFVAVPSDYVYPLPEDLDPKKGTLLRLVVQIKKELDRTKNVVDRSGNCIVIGDTPKGKLATQVIDNIPEYSGTQRTKEIIHSTASSENLTEYDVIIDAVGTTEISQQIIKTAGQGSMILLLGTSYGEFDITNKDIIRKTITKIDSLSYINEDNNTDLIVNIDVDSILDGTYDMEDFDIAYHQAKEGKQFPLISIKP